MLEVPEVPEALVVPQIAYAPGARGVTVVPLVSNVPAFLEATELQIVLEVL
jgi:hypothetical protein